MVNGIKKVDNYISYEEYEKAIPINLKKVEAAKNKIEIFDTYEEYEQNVAEQSKKNHEMFKVAEIISNNFTSYITDDYKKEIDKKIEDYGIVFDSEQDKNNIYNYMIHIDGLADTKYMKFSEKIKYAKYLMNYDKENGYRILFSTPTLKSGTLDIDLNEEERKFNGKYLEYYNPSGIKVTAPLIEYKKDENGDTKEYALEAKEIEDYIWECNNYYNDIMQKTYNQFSEKFRNQVLKNMKNITLINANYVHDWAAVCTPVEDYGSNVIIDMQQVIKNTTYMHSAYTHELGHAFSNASSSKSDFLINNLLNRSDIASTSEWKNIYEQINKNDSSHSLLRDYAHSDQYECFAECVTEYYGDETDCNPNDLKAIDIEINGKETTLYDYMDQLLN